MMADQLAVAINNARLLKSLDEANRELVRTKTFESIATATGETIHWVGNKAAPIPGCVDRTREDIARFLYVAATLLAQADDSLRQNDLAQLIIANGQAMPEKFPTLADDVTRLQQRPLKKLRQMLSAESVLEDLDIIEKSAKTILQIKEDLIGPARHQKQQQANLVETVREAIRGFPLPAGTVSYSIDGIIPPVYIDAAQVGRVVLNLVKNAMEAMDERTVPHIFVAIRQVDARFVIVDIADNGCGIAEEELTKIWLTFHTSKAKKGGTGLGLPACLQIMERMGGRISVVSEPGLGSTFTLHVPIYRNQDGGQI